MIKKRAWRQALRDGALEWPLLVSLESAKGAGKAAFALDAPVE